MLNFNLKESIGIIPDFSSLYWFNIAYELKMQKPDSEQLNCSHEI